MAASRLCSIDGCDNPSRARGWCQAHWIRWRKYGDPLKGGPRRYEAREYLDQIVLNYQGGDCLLWPYSRNGCGYGRIGIDGKRDGVHRIVCERIHGPAPTDKHEAAHLCGKGHLGCVAPNHLVWKTRSENFADKLIHGTHNRGEKNGFSKLSEAEAKSVKRLRKAGLEPKDIAAKTGVKIHNVKHIVHGNSWVWLNPD